MLAIFLAAFLPPPGLHYFARTEYHGPGLVCGAAFAVRLRAGEHAVLLQPSAVYAEIGFTIREGKFTIRESQSVTRGGTRIRADAAGTLWRKRSGGRYIFSYRDMAPGSTDIFGPAIDRSPARGALARIEFGPVRNGTAHGVRCMDGVGFDPR